MIPYIEREVAADVRLNSIVRHMLGLFTGVPGARAFRRHLATAAVRPGAGAEVLREALSLVADGAAFAGSAAA
jgi:tRNA-dihydrouridine synthase A